MRWTVACALLLAACTHPPRATAPPLPPPPEPLPADARASADATSDASKPPVAPVAASPAKPAKPAAVPPVVAISAGGNATCARFADGSARCWGADDFGQLGDDGQLREDHATPVLVRGAPPGGFATIVTGGNHTCAIGADTRRVWCWGVNFSGEVGIGIHPTDGDAPVDVPTLVPGLRATRLLSAGGHTCALGDDRVVRCWGDWDAGIGDPRTAGSTTPVEVPGVGDAVALASGHFMSCAIAPSGVVRCWRTSISPGLIPRGKVRGDPQLVGVSDARSIAVGESFACAARASGAVKCFATPPYHVVRLATDALSDAVEVAVGTDFVCARTPAGTVSCATEKGVRPVPGLVGRTVVELAAGYAHACARTSDGAVLCWGENDHGQLGDGTNTARAAATPVNW